MNVPNRHSRAGTYNLGPSESITIIPGCIPNFTPGRATSFPRVALFPTQLRYLHKFSGSKCRSQIRGFEILLKATGVRLMFQLDKSLCHVSMGSQIPCIPHHMRNQSRSNWCRKYQVHLLYFRFAQLFRRKEILLRGVVKSHK
jgi:hypothetical protein